jgi:hypothetical protein
VSEILALPRSEWVLKPLFTRGSLVVVYGLPGAAKTFVVIGWSFSVSTGISWLEHEVASRGRVVFVAAEGKGGLKKRVAAWLQANQQVSAEDLIFITEPVRLLNEDDVNLLLTKVTPLQPTLVALDTFAMCFDGDENHSRDMALAIAAAKRIIRETGATVILVHHTVKNGSAERGHSALRAAADTMMLVEAKKDAWGGTVVEISNTKQKDEEPFVPIRAQLRRVVVGQADDGTELKSCVLESCLTESSPRAPSAADAEALNVLVKRFADGAHTSCWHKAIEECRGKTVADRTYHNHRSALLAQRLVEPVTGKRGHYRPTEAGKDLIRPSSVLSDADDKKDVAV